MREKFLIFTDGGSRSNPGIAGAGVFIQKESGETIQELSRFLGIKTNNEAEYLAFIEALKFLQGYCQSAEAEKRDLELEFFSDSKLLVEQIQRNWKIKEKRLAQLAQEAWNILEALPYPFKIKHVLREKNYRADILANLAMDTAQGKS